MTDSSQTRLASIDEVTYGTTPASPAFDTIRITGESLKPALQYISSNEIRADRNIPDLTLVGSEAGGAVNFEFSYGTFDKWLESLMYSTWSTNVLKNGVTQKSMTLEKKFEAGATDQYHRYVGSVANTMSLNVQSKQQVTGSFGFLCKSMSSAQAILTLATYNAANSNPVINAANNFASLTITGVSSPQIVGLTLNVNNNIRQQPIVGAVANKGIGAGRFMVTGTLDAYFETNDMLDLYLGDTSADLSFELGGTSSLKYLFDCGKIKFSDAEIIAGGNDQDVMARMTWQALYSSGDASSLTITRTP